MDYQDLEQLLTWAAEQIKNNKDFAITPTFIRKIKETSTNLTPKQRDELLTKFFEALERNN